MHFQLHLASAGAARLVQRKLSHLLQLIPAGTYFYLSGVRFCSTTKDANENRKAHNACQHPGYITSPQVEVLVAHPLLNTYLLPEPVSPRNLRMPQPWHHSSSNTITVSDVEKLLNALSVRGGTSVGQGCLLCFRSNKLTAPHPGSGLW